MNWEDELFHATLGIAGTGKTYLWKERAKAKPKGALVLCATTGVAAININGVTIHSLLGYSDTTSMYERFKKGGLVWRLRELLNMGVRYIAIDEMSMMPGVQLDMLTGALDEVNGKEPPQRQMHLILIGDFCQLPPVDGDFCFEADTWDRFESTTEILQTVYRQTDPAYITALQLARAGVGDGAAQYFQQKNLFASKLDENFDGPTIVARNSEVQNINARRLRQLSGDQLIFKNTRGGRQRYEWKNIPETLTLRVGALVMVLVNKKKNKKGSDYEYVNGDLGTLIGLDETKAYVELHRTGEETPVPYAYITHSVQPEKQALKLQKKYNVLTDEELADGVSIDAIDFVELGNRLGDRFGEFLSELQGWIRYMPLRCAYASTVHKMQGLTVDRAQLHFVNPFFGNPSSMYVALSRTREPEGLRLVGDPATFVQRCKVDKRVRRFL